MNTINLELLRKLHIERGGNMTWGEIVQSQGLAIPAESLRKRVQRYEHSSHAPLVEDVEILYQTGEFPTDTTSVQDMQQRIAQLEKILVNAGLHRDQDDLLYEPYPPNLNDTDKWLNWQRTVLKKKPFVSVMIWSDIHMPDHSSTAISLAKNLLSVAKPDVLVYAGDMFDFDSLSTFAKSRRRRYKDAVVEVNGMWNSLTGDIARISPTTKQIAFRGNHDTRVDRYNDMAANPFADTTEEAFVEMVRSGGRVWWLGEYQETHVGCLFIQHGKRVGENAAKGAAKDQGWATSVVQGHNHRPGVYIHRVNDPRDLANYRVITSVSSGALCNIPPHYQMDTKQSTWLNGIVMAHVDSRDDTVNIQNLVFHRKSDTGKMWVAYGDSIVTSE